MGPFWGILGLFRPGHERSGQVKSGQDRFGDHCGLGLGPDLGREGFTRHIRMALPVAWGNGVVARLDSGKGSSPISISIIFAPSVVPT